MHLQIGPSIDIDRANRGCVVLMTILGAILFIIGVAIGNVAK